MPTAFDIQHQPEHGRFEIALDGHRGVLRYVPGAGGDGGARIVIPSVQVDPAIEGRGVAAALTRAALDWARSEGLRVDPVCPYVDAWLRRHPDYDDLRD